jgi:seryl-tRNA synthetase
MTNLFQLVGQYRELQALDIEDIDETTLRDTLEALGGELEIKATNVALYHQNVQAFANAITEASQKMAVRAKAVQARADSLKQYLKGCMEAAQITKIESPELSLKIKNNPHSLVISPDAVIPSMYVTERVITETTIDKNAIKAAIKAGQSVDGCHLEQATRLEIK